MQYNKKWYSVVVSILMVGFLLIISTWVFHLVLVELNDNRGRENYLRASAGAEWAMELALLEIKQKGYGYYDAIEPTVNDRSVILSKNPLDSSKYKSNDVRISYSMDSKVQSYTGSIEPVWFDIIPLFFIDNDASHSEKRITEIDFKILSGPTDTSWNIVSTNGGVSGIGAFDSATLTREKRIIAGTEGKASEIIDSNLWNFLSDSIRSGNYLILFNASNTDTMEYSLLAGPADEYFTKPRAEIISSAQVGKYKQNYRTLVNNTEYLNVLKYSVFGN